MNPRQGHTEASDAHRCDAEVAPSEATCVRCKLASVKSTDAAKLHILGRARKRSFSRTASLAHNCAKSGRKCVRKTHPRILRTVFP